MGQMGVNAMLFAGKWALIVLVYAVLVVVVISVRREMAARAPAVRAAVTTAGRLKVVKAGSDANHPVGQVLPLKPETRLGSAADNDLVLTDLYISKHHACLRWDGAAWWVEDLGSSNGTLANGQACPPRKPQPIQAGARLQLGDMLLELMV